MENYQKLKEIIQKANPEIMKIQRGCYITGEGLHNAVILEVEENHPYWFAAHVLVQGSGVVYYDNLEKENIQIVGRDIRLADVLLATEMYGEYLAQTDWRQVSLVELLSEFWNLKDDNLDNQSSECKEFLIKLLC